MKSWCLYFDAPGSYNQKDTEHRNKWVVGHLDPTGYRHRGTLDLEVYDAVAYDDFESALAALKTRMESEC